MAELLTMLILIRLLPNLFISFKLESTSCPEFYIPLWLLTVKTHNTLKNNISYEKSGTAAAASARGNRKPEKE